MSDRRVDQLTTVNPSLTDLIMLVQNGEAVNTTLARIRNLIVGSGSLETAATDIIEALNEINTKESNNATSITNLKNKIGTGDFSTTSQNAVGAVAELKEGVDNLTESVATNIQNIADNTASLNTNTQNITNHKNALVTDSSGVHGLKVETGTFTPSLIGGTSGEVTYNGRAGIYTKVGNICTFSFNLQYASINGSQGYMIFTGLPYRAKMAMPLSFLTASVGIGNSKYIIAYLENGNQIVLYRQDGIEKLQTTDLADVGGWFNIGGTYIVSEE